MRATDAEKTLSADIWQNFHNQNYEKAQALLAHGLESSDHPRFKRIQARFHLFEGREAEAANLLKEVLPKVWTPGSWELALAGSGMCRAKVLKDQKILYFPLRKCGSTSLLNMMKILVGEDARGEHVHREDHTRKSVNLTTVAADYPGYFSCTAVRDPIDRLLSFYHGNIVGRDHLMVEYDGKAEFYGLLTKPDLDYFLENLTRYRQVFISVRDHTEPLVSSIGSDPAIFNWIGGMGQLADLADALSKRTGKKLPLSKDMASPDVAPELSDMPEEFMPLYADDYRLYGQYF